MLSENARGMRRIACWWDLRGVFSDERIRNGIAMSGIAAVAGPGERRLFERSVNTSRRSSIKHGMQNMQGKALCGTGWDDRLLAQLQKVAALA